MKIFFADGRLGNQVFQYVFLKSNKKNNEKLIVSGFEDLQEVFEIDDVINFNKKNRWIRGFLFRIMKPLLVFFSDKLIFSSTEVIRENILEKYSRESTLLSTKQGLIKSINFVKLGFFQSESFFSKGVANKLVIKPAYLKKASQFLQEIPMGRNKIFIHIRRGDYKNYTVYGQSTLLPLSYYKEKIQWFLKNRDNCFFVFLSDDPEFVKKEFYDIENKIISYNNDFGTDLAIMTLCTSAILSPSSFSWWGSYLMKERDAIFAPKYWLGFNSGISYQSNPMPVYINEKK